MKIIYMIKELCPMWNDGTGVEYKVIKPYIFTNENEAEECRLDYEYISGDRVLYTEYELINLEVEDNLETLKEIYVESELIKIRNIIDGDYEEEIRYNIHNYDWLDSAGRLSFESNDEESDIEDFDDWVEHDYLYSGYEFY